MKKKPTKKAVPPKKAPALTMRSVLAMLDEILEEVEKTKAICVDTNNHVRDIDIELSSQGEAIEEQGQKLDAMDVKLDEIILLLRGPFQETSGSDLTQTSGDTT